MANKRNLKKSINYICEELFAETIATSLYGTAEQKASADELLATIILTRNDFIKRISHPEPGLPAKKYFNVLIQDFEHRAADIIDRIGAIG